MMSQNIRHPDTQHVSVSRPFALRSDGNLGFELVVELQALRLAASELSKTATLKCGDALPIGDLGHSLESRSSFTTRYCCWPYYAGDSYPHHDDVVTPFSEKT